MFNERRHGTICPYCNVDTAERPASVLGKDETADLPMRYAVARPVCGWLVCIAGPSKGRDYKIRAGKNFIGRADDMDIQILGDNEITHHRHAIIAYDPKKQNTMLLPGDSSGLVYLKEEPVYTPMELQANDMIEIGQSRFLFVPFCGEHFVWEDVGDSE
jgi:hypothetical protein